MAHDPLQVGTLTAEPGQRAYGYVAVRAAGVDLQIPIFLICGAQPGPTLSVTAGIHGAEYASVEAALRLGRTLDPATLRGRVIVAPIANTLAFAARSIYITPPDGKNLNRQFPGLANGTFTQALAYWLFQEVIQQGDAFIDLHGGDMIEALVPFVIHYRSGDAALDQAAVALARAFALPYVVPSESGGGTYSAAAGAGIPAILAEAGGQGIWSEETVGLLHTGMLRALAHLGMIDAALPAAPPSLVLPGWSWLRSEHDGLFYPKVQVGERVWTGQDVGRVADAWGNTLQPLTAPRDGQVLFLVTALAMNNGDPLMAIGG